LSMGFKRQRYHHLLPSKLHGFGLLPWRDLHPQVCAALRWARGIYWVGYFGVVTLSSNSQRLAFLASVHIFFFRQNFLDLPGRIQPPLSRAGAPGLDFLFPYAAVHVLGPEGPCSALPGSGVVDRAAIVLEKWTVPVPVPKLVPAVLQHDVAGRKLRNRNREVRGETPAVPERKVDIAVVPPGHAAFALALALKADAAAIKLFSLAHSDWCPFRRPGVPMPTHPAPARSSRSATMTGAGRGGVRPARGVRRCRAPCRYGAPRA